MSEVSGSGVPVGVMSFLQLEAVECLASVAGFLASCGEVPAMSARPSRVGHTEASRVAIKCGWLW